MKRVRLLVIVMGTVFLLGMLLWLVDFVLRIRAAIALFSPLLAQIFGVAMLLLGLAAIGLVIYYVSRFSRPRRRSRPVPQDKIEAASEAIAGHRTASSSHSRSGCPNRAA